MIFRVDRDSDERLTTRELEFLSAKLTPLHFDAIVVSDYAKGMVTQELYDMLIDFAILHKIPVFVDPHPQSKVNYRGCLYLVPNMLEALALVCASLSDKNSLEKLTSKLSAKYYSSIIITDGANGAYVFQKDERYVEHVPGRKIKSNNVCGAGDTFLAAFVYATLAGYPCRDSVQIANAAASIVATKPGTATITLEELNRILEL